ncbi:hypothetical protein C8Q80DRAFT_249405 [Daedaleopsis nitida]|nr:hypothetical protein C8Q80DRAFT_249405 [Daedaleopsis nitida]
MLHTNSHGRLSWFGRPYAVFPILSDLLLLQVVLVLLKAQFFEVVRLYSSSLTAHFYLPLDITYHSATATRITLASGYAKRLEALSGFVAVEENLSQSGV